MTVKSRTKIWRRILRMLVAIVGVVLLLCMALLVLLQLRPVRDLLLPRVVSRIGEAAPGELVVQGATWERLGSLSIKSALWTQASDTLLSVRDVRLELDVRALVGRQLKVQRFEAEVEYLDVPSMTNLPGSRTHEKTSASVPYLRSSGLGGLPSLQLQQVHLVARRIKLSPKETVRGLQLEGQADLSDAAQLSAAMQLQARVRNLPLHLGAETKPDQSYELWLDADLPRPDASQPSEKHRLVTLQGHSNQATGKLIFEGKVGIPAVAELRTLPMLSETLAGLPDLQALVISLAGSHDLDAVETVVTARFEPNEWLDSGRIELRRTPSRTQVDTLNLNLRDLELRGDFSQAGEQRRGQVLVRATGLEWLRPFTKNSGGEPEAIADSLSFDLRASIDTQRRNELESQLHLTLQRADFRLEELSVVAECPTLSEPRLRTQWQALLLDTYVASSTDIAWRDDSEGDILIDSAPIQVRVAPTSRRSLELPVRAFKPSSHIRLRPDSLSMNLRNLLVQGDLGDWTISGDYAKQPGGQVEVAAVWHRPPAVLWQHLSLEPAQRSAIDSLWSDSATIHLQAKLLPLPQGAHPGEVFQSAEARFDLPGPSVAAPLWSPQAQLDDWQRLAGSLRFTRGGTTARDWTAELDLSSTTWIDSSRFHLSSTGEVVQLDDVFLQIDGTRFSALGTWHQDSLNVNGELHLPDERLLRRFNAELPEELQFDSHIQWNLEGSPKAPDGNLHGTSRLVTSGFRCDSLIADLNVARGHLLQARLEAPSGLTIAQTVLRSVQLDYRALSDSSRQLPGVVEFRTEGIDTGLDVSAEIERLDGFLLTEGQMNLRYQNSNLRTQSPFRAHAGSSGTHYRVSDLDFAGELGHLRGSFSKSADSLFADIDAELQLPPLPQIPPGLQPDRIFLQAYAGGGDSLQATIRATGLHIGTRDKLELHSVLRYQAETATATLRLGDDRSQVVTLSGSIQPDGSAPQAEMQLIDFPLPPRLGHPLLVPGYLDRQDVATNPVLNGQLKLEGASQRPHASLTAAVTFPGRGQLRHDRLEMQATLSDSASQQPLQLDLMARNQKRQYLETHVQLPLWLKLHPVRVVVEEEAPLLVKAEAHIDEFGRFETLLPTAIEINGSGSFDFQASGPKRELDLKGNVRVRDLRAAGADGLRAQLKGELDLSGTSQAPVLGGKIVVNHAMIPIPEQPKPLHPVQGGALLWEKEETDDTADSTAAQVRLAESKNGALPGIDNLKSDVVISVPSGLWIRGRGLDVELRGDLQVASKEGRTAIVGELRATRGELELQGNRIPITRGTVTFFGDENLNPTLHLVLEKQYEEITVRVVVHGKAKDPAIRLESEPTLSDQDILSYLFFGRSFGDLDASQTTRLEHRAIETAAKFTAKRISDWVGRQLGVEMLEVRRSSQDDTTALIVGKYLSPNVLVRYAQDLEKGRGFAINLEYWLARGLRLTTHTSRYDQSGVELNWSKDY